MGRVTSGTVSPTLQYGIGLGYIESSAAQPDTPMTILIRNKEARARIVKTPFIAK